MAVVHRSSSSIGLGVRTQTILPAPAGIQDKDILVIAMYVTAVPTPAPTGFNFFTNLGPLIFPISPRRLRVWWKRADSESGDYIFDHISATTNAWMGVYSGGITVGSVEDVAPSTNTGNIDPTILANGITTVTDGSMIIYVSACLNVWPASPSPPSGSTPTFTERYDPGALDGLHIADGPLLIAGATGNKTVTGGPVLGDWVSTLIAIKAAAIGGQQGWAHGWL